MLPALRSRGAQVLQEFRRRLDPCHQQVIPRPSAGDVEEMPLGLVDLAEVTLVETPLRARSQDPTQRHAPETVFGRPRAPLLSEPIDGHAVFLAPASLECRHLRGARRRLPARGHQLEDLATPPREVLDHPARHALDIGGSVLDGLPSQSVDLRKLCPKGGLVEVAGGLGVPV